MWWLTHAHCRQQLSAYVDGQLSGRQRDRLEGHLSACPACRSELQGLRATKAALHSLPLQEVPHSFALRPEQVRARPRPAVVRGLALTLRLAGAALAAALAIALVVDLAELGGDGAATPVQEAAPARTEFQKEMPLAPAGTLFPGEEGADAGYTVQEAARPPAVVPTEGGLDPLRAAEVALGAALGATILAAAAFTLAIRRSR